MHIYIGCNITSKDTIINNDKNILHNIFTSLYFYSTIIIVIQVSTFNI